MTLTLSHLTVNHRLQDVSLTCEPGKVTALLGENGAGKTTLLRAACGLLKPASGEITLNGAPLSSLSFNARAKAIAFLPQQATCHWNASVRDVIALGRLPHEGAAHPGHPAVRHAAEAADVMPLLERDILTLSAGERQRVFLARALATEPQFLLADEPIASLDPRHQLSMMALLKRQAASGMGVIVALHDLTLALRFCARAVLLSKGRLLAEGTPADVLTDNNLRFAFGIEAERGAGKDGPYILPSKAV
ncbi:MAG: ABC transporter ATP-binding protein [Alphaproteobacteria bacterium]|nr:ABC transporter ATP-binding protein [Alphaproteobacteria bacterium]